MGSRAADLFRRHYDRQGMRLVFAALSQIAQAPKQESWHEMWARPFDYLTLEPTK